MYRYFVLLSIFIQTSMGTIFRQNYQDESSWGFKHPTNRYEKININGQLVQTLTTIPMDASSMNCYTQCAIYCNMVECCNVARCNITDNTCSVGLHRHPVEVVGGEAFMVRKQLVSKIQRNGLTTECAAGIKGAGGACDCRTAIGVNEGKWWEPWCHEGKCYTGQAYNDCVGKSNGHKLGDGTWCFNGDRNTKCPTTPGIELYEGDTIIEFEEIEGNGYCADSKGNHDVAKIIYMNMPHEDARNICRMDDNCVAYAYSMDNELNINGIYHNVVIYSNTSCTINCGNDEWQTNSYMIAQTNSNGLWNDGKCYVKRSYDYYLHKCIVNPTG